MYRVLSNMGNLIIPVTLFSWTHGIFSNLEAALRKYVSTIPVTTALTMVHERLQILAILTIKHKIAF